MEITKTSKLKAFAQYLGQPFKVVNWHFIGDRTMRAAVLADIEDGTFPVDPFQLILRPISSLTDEECIEIYDRGDEDFEPIADEDKIQCIRGCLADDDWSGISLTSAIQLTDYLRSIGIDLPSIYLGGKTLQEAGLAIYKEVKP